jgi:lysozyme
VIGRVIDVSSDQHPNNAPIDWPAVARAGVTTALIKATQGTTYVNPWLASDLQGASEAGLQVRCYHFADFTNADAEAAFFLQHAGRFARAGDFETSRDVAWMRQFLQALGAPADQLLAYGSASTLVGIYQQLPAMAWVAEYQVHSPGWGVLWQFSETATIPGITGPVDEDRWQGSEIQYDIYFGIYDPVPIPEEDYEIMSSVVLSNGTIVSYAVGAEGTPIAGHLLEITRKAGTQGLTPVGNVSVIDITATYPQFVVAP